MKFYIATRLERWQDHNKVRDALIAEGHQITYDWTHHGPVFGGGEDRIKEVALMEMGGVLSADFLVVMLPGGRGTHVEFGMAIAADIPVFLLASDEDAERFFRAVSETCAFYWTPGVTQVSGGIEELLLTLEECDAQISPVTIIGPAASSEEVSRD